MTRKVGIEKINSIKNMAVFRDFEWGKAVSDENNKVTSAAFGEINIFYGRNYSGKTTLSRIFRAMEIGELSSKFENTSFKITLANGSHITETDLKNHGEKIRVFNEDFIRNNLRFIIDPDDSIKSFAILGGGNNKIEEEIRKIKSELGSNEEGNETGLYAKRMKVIEKYEVISQRCKKVKDKLQEQLRRKAIDKKNGIKYKFERFGDQNYNTQKLKNDICKVQKPSYQIPTDDKLKKYEDLISQKPLGQIQPFRTPSLNASDLIARAEALITKKISEANKIDELVKDAILNKWVGKGRDLHEHKRNNCAFCGNSITDNRWRELERHFDEESEKLEEDIKLLLADIDQEKRYVTSFEIDETHFYPEFHEELNQITQRNVLGEYKKSLEALTKQLCDRKDSILIPISFNKPNNFTSELKTTWESYEKIRKKSNDFSSSLGEEQVKAKESLLLKEVHTFLATIQYEDQISNINELEQSYNERAQEKKRIEKDISYKENQIALKERELTNEEKGAKRVNKYLNNFFGHQFLSLEAFKDDILEDDSIGIRFEVVRDGKKAYHLSEGENRLLAFCYFMAKLDDVDTKDIKPIIWIDDPVSSLDSNHIFFVYALIAKVVSVRRFEQLFVSTHNLNFLKYLKRLRGKYEDGSDYQKKYFVINRQGKESNIERMPQYLKEYLTEFNYLFHQIYNCARIKSVDDSNYTTFYNFGNNARKFLEIYLYYKYPDRGMNPETLRLFFGKENIPAVLTDRVNNEYSHLCANFERGSTPVEEPEMQLVAKQIIKKLKEDESQYLALCKSIGLSEQDFKRN